MDAKVHRVEFDATLDEIVDASVRMVQPTSAYRNARKGYQWLFGACVAGGLTVAVLHRDAVPSYTEIAIVLCVGSLGGILFGMFGGRFYDSHVRRHHRRVIGEMYGGVDVVHCEFELRDETLWSRSVHGEVSFPWSRLTRVADRPGLIELWFSPGLAVIRDRAFPTQEDRHAFLDAVRGRLP